MLAPDAALLAALALLAYFAPSLGAAHARALVLNLGPNDADYVQGFREDWERLGRTRFHWTTLSARIILPVTVAGEGHVLRMRARRHFLEPAQVVVTAEGRTVGAPFDIRADERVAYQTLELSMPPLRGEGPLRLSIESRSENPRPLGLALDWLEIERRGAGRFAPLPHTALQLVAAVLAAVLGLRLAGAARVGAGAAGLALTGIAAWGMSANALATERILREGTAAFCMALAAGVALVRWRRARGAFGIEAGLASPILVGLLIAALTVRIVLLLHPEFYYPDVRIHAQFAWQLSRRGLMRFLSEFTANQYRYSLGLQYESGHWYAFPYPPVFYLACWPLLRLLRYRPEVAVSLVAAVVNSLEIFLIHGIARRLGVGPRVALAAAMAHPLLPIFIARLALAYFPALVGHFVDAAVILFLLARYERMNRPRPIVAFGVMLGLALLTYTQSLLNFALLLPAFVGIELLADRSPEARRRQIGLVMAGALGVLVSLVFYARYVPIVLEMRRGVPMAEERVLIEKLSRPPAPDELEAKPEEPDDPYAGPSVDPIRGLRKAASRLWIFYAGFSLAICAGLLLVFRRTAGSVQRFVCVWAAVYLLLNLASGGLPGPNLVRYNKDLEIVAPLFCIALGALGVWLAERGRLLAVLYATGFWVFGAVRALRYLTEKFVLER